MCPMTFKLLFKLMVAYVRCSGNEKRPRRPKKTGNKKRSMIESMVIRIRRNRKCFCGSILAVTSLKHLVTFCGEKLDILRKENKMLQ